MKGGCASQWKAAAGLLFCVMVFASAKRPVFTNNFLVELHKGGEEEARQVAAEHGFGVRKLPFTEGLYHFYHNGLAKARRKRSLHHKQLLERDPRVSFPGNLSSNFCHQMQAHWGSIKRVAREF
uniref:Proprotein convertase subtilisin/kexin type 2 n=1 Tax=Myotis myotis TaxID=51298 RepID=A0A7J7VZS2_MYOMY|nr:proprotein convertase subtilisin/kexin type 2 [Myotis myotis]